MRVFCATHAACRLEADALLNAHIADDLQHDARAFRGRVHRNFTGRGFDEVGAGFDGDFRRFTNQRIFFQFAGFDNHFQQHVCCRAGFFTGFHQVKTDLFVAGNQRAVREHDVNFVSAVSDRRAGFRQRDINIIVTVREVSHRRDADVRGTLLVQRFTGNRDKTRVDTDRSGITNRGFRLMTQRDHLLIGVVIVQGGQVHQFQRAQAACR